MSNKFDKNNAINAGIGLSLNDVTKRFGSANAEFLKGMRGIDYESAQVFDRSLMGIAEYKVNPDLVDANIKQQAGYSAEVAAVGRKNAENILKGDPVRTMRTEDVAGFGKNHTVIDLIDLADGKIVQGSTSQMKFVNNHKHLLNKIAKGKGEGKTDLSRYMEVDKLELPTEQVESAKQHCRNQAASLRQQADRIEAGGDAELAVIKHKQANNFDQLDEKISDSGMTTKEAINYRTNPDYMTTKDIHRVSHRAGLEGAKFGAAIGGSISLVTNIIALSSGDKEFSEAAMDVALDTGTSAGVGYMTASAGSAIKGYMQQSPTDYARVLSKTALPALVVSVCIACGKTIQNYATQDDFNEIMLLSELGNTAGGMVSSSMFASIGQIAIPVPILGGLIGGMIGYTLSNMYHRSYSQAMNDAAASRENLEIVKQKCRASIAISQAYKRSLSEIIDNKVQQFSIESKLLFGVLNNPNLSTNDFGSEINSFAKTLGKELQFYDVNEFNQFMSSDSTLKF